MSDLVTENKILINVAERLGLKNEPVVFQKGEQFLRIFQMKGMLVTLNDTAKAILCFDLAASIVGIAFDKETAMKLSGLKKPTYKNNLNVVEKMLELDKQLSVGEICVQFGCTEVKELAEKIFESYGGQDIITDFDHPQYAAASVYTACKLRKFKVQKAQFVAVSRLKAAQWKEIESEFDKFVNGIGLSVDVKAKKSGKNELHAYLEEFVQNTDLEHKSPKKSAEQSAEENEDEEAYEDWKSRILKRATAAVQELSD